MLRLSKSLLLATVAAALAAGVPASAQSGGLASRINEASAKLDQDVQTCRPIDLGEYTRLLEEAGKNKLKGDKAAKKGVPIDQAQIQADLANASALFARAQAAMVQQCLRAAQQSPQANQSKQGAMNLSPFAHDMLAMTNQLRAKYGAPPVVWNENIAAREENWAGVQAERGTLDHQPREGRGDIRENLAQVPANYSDEQAFGRWAREEASFIPGTFPNVCKEGGECSGVWHLTQILWFTVREIGCGKVRKGAFTTYACGYAPGGNKDGQKVGVPVQIASKLEQPALPKTEVFKNPMPVTSTPPGRSGAWYVGGDFGAMILEDLGFDNGLSPIVPDSAISQIALNHDYGYDSALFVGYDLGAFRIEAEVAYKRAELEDIYDPLVTGVGETSALNFMINGLLDFGDEDGLSGFVGAGVGVAKVDYNNVRPFSNQGAVIDESDTKFAKQIISELKGSPDPEVATNVDQPTLPNAEVYNSPTGSQQGTFNTDNLKEMGKQWNETKNRYDEAWKKCDAEGVKSAREELETLGPKLKGIMEATKEAGEFSKYDPDLSALNSAVIESKLQEIDAAKKWKIKPASQPAQTASPPPSALAEAGTPTKVDQPTLPESEVFKPADAPQCQLDIM